MWKVDQMMCLLVEKLQFDLIRHHPIFLLGNLFCLPSNFSLESGDNKENNGRNILIDDTSLYDLSEIE